MKRMRFVAGIVLLVCLLAGCEAKTMENMSRTKYEEQTAIARGDHIYVFHGFMSNLSLADKQIGILDNQDNYKVYSVKGYDDSEWILNHLDVFMEGTTCSLYRSAEITEIPDAFALSDEENDYFLKNAGEAYKRGIGDIVSWGIVYSLIAFVQVILFIGRLFVA